MPSFDPLLRSVHSSFAVFCVAIAVVAVLCAPIILGPRASVRRMLRLPSGRRPRAGAIRGRPILTSNELDFFATLRSALPDALVLAQVSFGAFLEPDGPAKGSSEWWSVRNRFGQKIADFVVLDGSGRLVSVVELDDKTHDRRRDAVRDSMLAAAGVGVVRYESRRKPEASAIRRDLGFAPRALSVASFS